MRTIKPLRLGVLHRVIEIQRRPQLIVSVFAATSLAAPKQMLPEMALWKLVEKSLGTGATLDEGYSKPAGEVLVHGSFFSPHGQAEPVSFVGLELQREGKKLIDKRLAILGRREWKHGVPSNPEPLSTLKLDWTCAFGGADDAINPAGRGLKPKDSSAPWLLPQIEDPKHLIVSPSDRPRPAGFGPMDLASVSRRALAGTYGEDYIEKHFPGPPPNFDARFFHTALEDQRIAGFFREGDRVAFINMNAERSRVEGEVPPLRGRAFVQRGVAGELVDVPLRIDTLIAFPNDGVLVSVHRGLVPVREDDASDITTLVIAAEDLSTTRPVEHYAEVVKRRTDRDKHGALWCLRDVDLAPPPELGWESTGLPEDDLVAMNKADFLLQKRAEAARGRMITEQRAKLAAEGNDPDTYLPLPPPEELPPPVEDAEGLIRYMEKSFARLEQEKADAEKRKLEAEEKAKEEAKRQGLDWEQLVAEARREGAGPPKPTAKPTVERMREQVELARNANMPLEIFEKMLEDQTWVANLVQQDEQLLQTYRMYAHYRDPAAPLEGDASAGIRQRLVEAHRAGKRPDEVDGRLDGTGADLSQLNLTGANLSNGLFECANLTNTVLDKANLENTVLTRAKLHQTRFVGANLKGANLGDTTFAKVDFSEASLPKLWFTKSRIEEASFVRADLAESYFLDSTLGKVDFSNANLQKVLFYKLDLRGARFSGANLEKAQFVECDLTGVDFTQANLNSAVFLKTRAEGACLAGASLIKSAWPMEVAAKGVDLRGAHVERACFRGAGLQSADLSGATLTQCDFGNADLTDAKLTEANAKGSLFIRANLTGVNARGASFMEAVLSNATLYGADFSKTNLYGAILSRARGDDKTRFTGAHLEVLLREPRYEKPEEESRG
ncbi:MAG: DUF2169 domain-containing protein [Polyangiaceae bacterium]